MSAATPPTPPPMPSPAPSVPEKEEISIYSHSMLFYWWPVWAFGFLFSLLTLIGGHVMAIVPTDSEAKRGWRVNDETKAKEETREGILVRPAKHEHHLPPEHLGPDGKLPDPEQPHLRVTTNKTMGVLFTAVLLIIIFITNVPMRGLWTVIVILLILLVIVLLAHYELWGPVRELFNLLDIRINLGGYMVIAVVLFFLWLQTMLFFDQQIYIKFSPGQMKVCTQIGGGEKVYDTMGMTVEKQRGDLFRHIVIGLGSGDLIVKTGGNQSQHFDFPNVLFIGRKVQEIEDMLRKRSVIDTKV